MANGEPVLSDADLVKMVKNQVASALESLYDRYGRVCYAMARKIIVDQQRAEDVVQEVFLALWKKPEAYDTSRSFETWIISVTHHKAVDAVRKEQRWRTWAEKQTPEETSLVEENAWESVRAEKVQEALKDLPQEQKEVLTLSYYGGMTQQQISEKTGTPLGTVKTRTLLAMRKLKKVLAPVATSAL